MIRKINDSDTTAVIILLPLKFHTYKKKTVCETFYNLVFFSLAQIYLEFTESIS